MTTEEKHRILVDYLKKSLYKNTLGKLQGPLNGKSFYEKFQQNRIDSVNEDTKIIEDGFFDSWALVLLKDYVERTFNVTIDDQEATVKTFATVRNIVSIVESKQ